MAELSAVITETDFKILAVDIAKLEKLALYNAAKVKDSGSGKDKKKELSLVKKSSPKYERSWRLIYRTKSKEALMLFESDGETITAWDMFCGTMEECIGEIKKLELNTTKIKNKIKVVDEKEKELQQEPKNVGR